MSGAFPIVVVAVAVIGALGAVIALLSGRRAWEGYGRDHLLRDSDPPGRARGGNPAASAERDDEIRQMLQARNARRRRRGEPELDVAAELDRLTAGADAPDIDDELRAEIRELVLAREARRARRAARGGPDHPTPAPFDVDAEVAREIARLTR